MIRRVVIIAGVLGVAVLLTPLALHQAGTWLVVENPLRPARSIAVLSGQVPFRAMEAARIYNAGLAPEVWLTKGHVSEEDAALAKFGFGRPGEYTYSERVLKRQGVPATSIRVLAGDVINTVAEIKAIAEELRAVHGQRVIVVTSKYHARRVLTVWHTVVGPSPELIVRYTPDDPFDPDSWWRTTGDMQRVAREWFGMLNAWAGLPARAEKLEE